LQFAAMREAGFGPISEMLVRDADVRFRAKVKRTCVGYFAMPAFDSKPT